MHLLEVVGMLGQFARRIGEPAGEPLPISQSAVFIMICATLSGVEEPVATIHHHCLGS